MGFKTPMMATLAEVSITWDGETAIIEPKIVGGEVICLSIGPEIDQLDDQEIVDFYNACIEFEEHPPSNHLTIATEIPPGKPQLNYCADDHHWIPRGDVLRCIIEENKDGETIILIDEHTFSMAALGELLSSCVGWGLRLTMVPDDEIDKNPVITIQEPEESEPSDSIPLFTALLPNTQH